jgi:hypothetical protein
MPVPPAVVRGLAVAITAEELQIFKPVVGAVAVHMVERHVEGLPPPFGEPAFLTTILLETCLQEPLLEVASLRSATDDEEFTYRDLVWARNDVTSLHGATPSRLGKTEALATLKCAKPRVVRLLNGLPVIATGKAVIDRNAESPNVKCDSALA